MVVAVGEQPDLADHVASVVGEGEHEIRGDDAALNDDEQRVRGVTGVEQDIVLGERAEPDELGQRPAIGLRQAAEQDVGSEEVANVLALLITWRDRGCRHGGISSVGVSPQLTDSFGCIILQKLALVVNSYGTLYSMMKFLGKFQTNGPLHKAARKWKDSFFTPAAELCIKLHLTPMRVTTLGLLIGVISVGLLFVNYWYFVIGFIISTLIDGVDGRLARLTNTETPHGAQYDYAVDLTMTLLVYTAITIWVEQPIWIFGLNAFGLLLLLNWLLGKQIQIFPGRMWLIVPIILGLPRIGLVVLLVYVTAMYVLFVKTLLNNRKTILPPTPSS